MRRLELLIEEARDLSQNAAYDSDSGLSQNVFVRYFKNAQDVIVREINKTKSKYFLKEKIYSTVGNQEEYSWPSDIFLHNVDTLEYSENGSDYVSLEKVFSKDRNSGTNGYAFGYVSREDGFLLAPPVSSGGYLRLNYIRNPNAPQKRCGIISSVTTSSGQITAITLNTGESSFDATLINKENYLCVVDKKGTQKVVDVEYTSVNSGTGVFTMSAHTLLDGESVSIGDYICVGERVTNKIELPDICESFLVQHVVYQVKFGDSSKWTEAARQEMGSHLAQLVASFAKNSDDVSEIAITNFDYLG